MALDFRNTLATRTYVTGIITVGPKKGQVSEKAREKAPKTYKPKNVNHAVIALKRCWNWAIENDYLPGRNPFSRIPMLPCENRQRIVTPEEFQTLLRNSQDDALFRQLLLFLRLTPIRPGELSNLTWDQVDWDHQRLVIVLVHSSRSNSL